jgi:uncharacterized protein (DUF983 family)
MKRCNYCFRISFGKPAYCTRCGRSYDLRLCPLGHRNLRTDQFCSRCGSAELSTAAPPPSLLARVSLVIVVGAAIVFAALVAATIAVVAWQHVAAAQFEWPLIRLAIVLLFLYWATTLLPGPIRPVGRRPSGKTRQKSN